MYEPDFGALRRCILGVHGFGGSKDTHILQALSEEMSFFAVVGPYHTFDVSREEQRAMPA